jgi:transposase
MVTVRRRSRLPTSLQEELVKHFVGGATARAAALLTGVNRHTATLFFHKLREVIAERLDAEAPELLGGEVEIDESDFGGRRKGKRGRGAGGKVHAVIIPNAGSKTIFPIIRARIQPDAVVYTDSFPAYDVLDVSEFRHMRINHINGIEIFWNQAKRHLRPITAWIYFR